MSSFFPSSQFIEDLDSTLEQLNITAEKLAQPESISSEPELLRKQRKKLQVKNKIKYGSSEQKLAPPTVGIGLKKKEAILKETIIISNHHFQKGLDPVSLFIFQNWFPSQNICQLYRALSQLPQSTINIFSSLWNPRHYKTRLTTRWMLWRRCVRLVKTWSMKHHLMMLTSEVSGHRSQFIDHKSISLSFDYKLILISHCWLQSHIKKILRDNIINEPIRSVLIILKKCENFRGN